MAKQTQIGNPNKGQCASPMLEDSVTFTIQDAAAGGVGSTPYTVPNDRGPVRALEIYCNNATIADLALAFVSLSANGISLLNPSPLLKHSTLYANAKKSIICDIPENATLAINGTNGSATDIVVTVVFLFYDPYVESLKSIIN